MKSLVKDGNYFVVQSFMVKDLKLKGLKRDLFAIIYGFSQGDCRFTGSLQYLADWLNSNRSTIQRNLKELVEAGFLEKYETIKNNIVFIEYCTKVNTVDKKSTPIDKKSTPVDKKSTNNIEYNIVDNIDIKERKKAETYDTIINESFEAESIKVKTALYEFIKMRKLIKKPLTNLALQKIINKLKTLTKNDSQQVAILEQSIMNCWQDIYQLKEERQFNGYNKTPPKEKCTLYEDVRG